MDDDYKTRKYEADKIALLGLFALGLLIARFITFSRYAGPRRAGQEVVADIKHKGIASLLDERGWQSFFLVKNARGRLIGFSMDAFTESGSEAPFRIQSTGLLYIRGRYGREQVMSFQTDDSFDEFSWKSESRGPGGRSGTEVTLAEDGWLRVVRGNRQELEHGYRPDASAVPDFLLDLVLNEMLAGGHGRIILDTVSAEGRVVEVVISRGPNAGSSPSEAGYSLDVDFLDEPRYSQKVYFDGQGRISKILMQWNGTYLFERAGVEDVLRHFPDWADYFLREGPD